MDAKEKKTAQTPEVQQEEREYEQIGANGVIPEEWLEHCTITPYRGNLKDHAGSPKGAINALIEIRNDQNRSCRRVQVVFCAADNQIYIAEKEFNRMWKDISQCIHRAKIMKAYRTGAPVPGFAEAEKQVDLSLYETENRTAVLARGQLKLVGKPVSEEQKQLMMKRSSAMDNKKMVYAYSAADSKVHDKACPLVKQISNQDFRASEEVPEGRWLCLHCRMMMVIRRGCGDDFKHCDWYQRFFKKGGVREEAVESLVDRFHANIRMEDRDTLLVKRGEEQWKIVLNGEKKVTLLHNNYAMLNETERYIYGGFHNQVPVGDLTMARAMKYIEDYNWEGHLAAKAEKRVEQTPEPMVVEEKAAKGFAAAMIKRLKAWVEALFPR